MTSSTLELQNVSLTRGGTQILKGASATFPPTGLYALIGPSGAGKTSLLMLLSGLESPTKGSITFESASLETLAMPAYRSKVVLQFQEPPPFPGTAKDNLLLPFRLEQHQARAPKEHEIVSMLSRCMLGVEVLEQDMETLSGGEKQRLALARTLLLQPRVLLLDEPTSALDASTEEGIVRLLSELSKTTLVICVTHSQEIVQNSDGIVAIDNGSVRQYGHMDKNSLDRLMEGQ